MTHNDCFQLGHITRPHGYKGAVVLFLDVDHPDHYRGLDAVFLSINGSLVPYFIKRADQRGNQLIVEFDGVEGEDAAERLRGCEAFLPLAALPKLKGNQFYYHEVIGFTVVDQTFGEIGTILSIMDNTANPLFVCAFRDKEALLPFHDQVLVKVDRAAKTIMLNLPEGFMDLYQGEHKEGIDD